MFYLRREAVVLEKEIKSISEVVKELVVSRIKIEFFVKGAIALYLLEYFGLKSIIAAYLS